MKCDCTYSFSYQQEKQAKESMSATQATQEPLKVEEDEFIVDPWKVDGVIDYNKLIDKFGSQSIDANLNTRIENVTSKCISILKPVSNMKQKQSLIAF